MRWRRRLISSCLTATTLLLPANIPVMAGQPDGDLDLSGVVPGLPRAESGKPAIGGAPSVAPVPGEAAPCAPALPCGTRLLGSIRKNGALELQVPALRW